MKKIIVVLLVFLGAAFNTFSQKKGINCPGGKCASDCWFTECQSCCGVGQIADCSCLFEFARCKCKANVLALADFARINNFAQWLKESDNKLLQIFENLETKLGEIKIEKINESTYSVDPEKYNEILNEFELSIKDYLDTDDYKNANTHLAELIVASGKK